MSELVNISTFSSSKGLDLNQNMDNMAYLYGMSDFWYTIFQDEALNDTLLSTVSVAASDIYNRFLQLCTGISIEDIIESSSSQLKLGILNDIVDLPTNVVILNGSWTQGTTTLSLANVQNFLVGDIIQVYNMGDSVYYYDSTGINAEAIDSGSPPVVTSGRAWNGTFTITEVNQKGTISYVQDVNPGPFTGSGLISTVSIGANTYILPDKIVSSRLIVNKPFLPDIVLEENVDFVIDKVASRISLAKPLNTYGFPTRVSATSVSEFSVWFADVRYDEDLMYAHFPRLIGRTPPALSGTDYRTFLYGLYYLYTKGPTVDNMTAGLNLSLGVPVALGVEEVVDVRLISGVDQYVIITNAGSYILPVGLHPTVSPGHVYATGEIVSKWIEIKDFVSDGPWWNTYPIEIPSAILPYPSVSGTRVVTGNLQYFPGFDTGFGINTNAINEGGPNNPYYIGDYANWLMATYFRYNTFLVKVNTDPMSFLGLQKFEDVLKTILDVRPSYTYPIFSYVSPLGKVLTPSGITTKVVGPTAKLVVGLTGAKVQVTANPTLESGYYTTVVKTTSQLGSMGINRDRVLQGATAAGVVGSVGSAFEVAMVKNTVPSAIGNFTPTRGISAGAVTCVSGAGILTPVIG